MKINSEKGQLNFGKSFKESIGHPKKGSAKKAAENSLKQQSLKIYTMNKKRASTAVSC